MSRSNDVTFKVEVIDRVCILNVVERKVENLVEGERLVRLAAGTPKMVGDAVRIHLANVIDDLEHGDVESDEAERDRP